MQVTIPVTKGREVLFQGKWYPMGYPVDVDFSTAVRMRRDLHAVVPFVKSSYDPSVWRDGRNAALVADIDEMSGWGNVGLNLLRWSRGAKFSLVGKAYNVRDPYVAAASSREVNPHGAAIWHEQPKAEWLMSPFSRNIAIVPFETTLVPPSWVPRINSFDAILVPCEQNRQMMEDSGVKVPIEVIHWGVDPDKFYEIRRQPRDAFTFGTMGALSRRKGTHILVDAFVRAFPNERDVRLICKTSNRFYPFMVKNEKRIEVQMGPVSHDDLFRDFFERIDCFVSPTLGEGFGLTPLEAMATGVPAIVTGWSGPKEYMNGEVGWEIEHSMDEAQEFSDPKNGVYREYCGRWAIPSIDHLAYLMRYAYEHRDEVREKGRRAAQYVREEWTWQRQIHLFEEAIDRHL